MLMVANGCWVCTRDRVDDYNIDRLNCEDCGRKPKKI